MMSAAQRGLRAGSILLLACWLAACSLPGSAAPVVKIGVIAPFEGAGRPLGYAALPAVKAAVAAANSGAALGPYRVAVVAFNDSLDAPTAAEQARALALDPAVLAVVGPFSQETVASAAPILASAGLANLPVAAAAGSGGDSAPQVAAARAATQAALDALAADIRAAGRPTRAGVAAHLAAGTAP